MLRLLVATMLACLFASAADAAPRRYAFQGGMQHVVTNYCGDRVCGVVETPRAKRVYAKVQRTKYVKVAARAAAPVARSCVGIKAIGSDIVAALVKGVSLPVDLVERTIRFFIGKGYTLVQAAGIAGNIKAESNFNVHDVGDGGRARGLAQWHPDRFRGLRKLAAEKSVPVTDFHTQLEYIDLEMRERERLAYDRVKAARTVREATAAFVHFERPQWYTVQRPERAHSFSQRLKWAIRYAEQYAHHEPAIVSAGI